VPDDNHYQCVGNFTHFNGAAVPPQTIKGSFQLCETGSANVRYGDRSYPQTGSSEDELSWMFREQDGLITLTVKTKENIETFVRR
jgi:hypothetical protein